MIGQKLPRKKTIIFILDSIQLYPRTGAHIRQKCGPLLTNLFHFHLYYIFQAITIGNAFSRSFYSGIFLAKRHGFL